jgi:hypothetical protein
VPKVRISAAISPEAPLLLEFFIKAAQPKIWEWRNMIK